MSLSKEYIPEKLDESNTKEIEIHDKIFSPEISNEGIEELANVLYSRAYELRQKIRGKYKESSQTQYKII